MRRTNEEIIKNLQGLHRIEPGTEYIRNSRHLILTQRADYREPQPGVLVQVVRSFSFAFETTLVAALFLVVILGGVFGLSKSFFLPPLQGIDEKALLTEADAINYDINFQLNEIAYFGVHKTSTERVVALDAERVQSQKEKLPLTETVTDQEIDKLLNQVINEY